MNRLSDKFGDRFSLEGDPIVDALGMFARHYKSMYTEEDKASADSLAYQFIDTQIKDASRRINYRRIYEFATGRKPKRPPSTRFIRNRQSVN